VKEVKQLEEDGAAVDFNNMEDRGFGDTIARFTKATGIKKLADKIPGGCGCEARQSALNKMLPYKRNK